MSTSPTPSSTSSPPGELTLVATGHRPQRLGLDYTSDSNLLLTTFAEALLRRIKPKVRSVVSGLAQGWDQAVAHAAILLGVPLIAAIPFEGQESKWPAVARKRYEAIRRRAVEVYVVSAGGYSPAKFLRRDEWMVDRAESEGGGLLALWDGAKNGGTWHTVKYAQDLGLGVINLWDSWLRYKSGIGLSTCGDYLPEEITNGTRTSCVGNPTEEEENGFPGRL